MTKWLPFLFKRERGDRSRETVVGQAPQPLGGSRDPMLGLMEDMLRGRALRDPLALLDTSPFSQSLGGLDSWFGDFRPRTFAPSMDVVDDGDALRVTAELPGLDADNVEVTIDSGVMTVRGKKQVEREKEEAGCYRLERAFGSFSRSIPLPADVDTAQADATFKNGVLNIALPKTEPGTSAARRIPISA